METTITIEIKLPISFTASPGYPATREEPGEPAHIEELDYNKSDAIQAINDALFAEDTAEWLDDELFEVAERLRDRPITSGAA